MEFLSCHTHTHTHHKYIHICIYISMCMCMYVEYMYVYSTFITLTCWFPRKAKKCITPPGLGFTDTSEPPHVGARNQTWMLLSQFCSSQKYHYNTENEYSPLFHPHHLEVMKVPATCSVTNWMNLIPLWTDSDMAYFSC